MALATSRTWHPKYPHWRSGHISDLASKISPLAWHARVVEEDVVALVRLLVLQWGDPGEGNCALAGGRGLTQVMGIRDGGKGVTRLLQVNPWSVYTPEPPG